LSVASPALIVATKAISRFGINHDALSIAPVWISVRFLACWIPKPQGLSLLFEQFDRVRRKTLSFNSRAIRQPLIMKARQIYSLLDVESVIDDVHQNIRNRSDDRWAARGAKHEKELVIFRDDGRRHCRQWTLVCSNCVCRSLD